MAPGAGVQTASLRGGGVVPGQARRGSPRRARACRPARRRRRVGLVENSRADRSVSRSTVSADSRSTSSSLGIGRPNSSIWRAICEARLAGLSADISRPARYWARARSSSSCGMLSPALLQLVDDHRHQLGDVALAGRGMDAEDAGIGKAPVEGVDRIAEAALLAHFLEQPRRHAAAEDHRQHLRGVEVAHMIGAALEAEHDLRVHQVAVLAEVAADIVRVLRQRAVRLGCGSRRACFSTSRTKSSCLTSPAATTTMRSAP